MKYLAGEYDVAVIGAGHAGCEAALASARLGLNTIIFTVSMDSVAMMPCNPNVGGSSKGHLVRELDALGGDHVAVVLGGDEDPTSVQVLHRVVGPPVAEAHLPGHGSGGQGHELVAQADPE